MQQNPFEVRVVGRHSVMQGKMTHSIEGILSSYVYVLQSKG